MKPGSRTIRSFTPNAGALSDRVGGRPLLAAGLALQAIGLGWIASVSTAGADYTSLVGPFVLFGIGMALSFALVIPRIRRTAETQSQSDQLVAQAEAA